MFEIVYTNKFRKDLKRCVKRGLDINKFLEVARILEKTGKLPDKYKPHLLTADRKGQWECHIQSDWLLIWEQDDNQLTLLFLETGRHQDLFSRY